MGLDQVGMLLHCRIQIAENDALLVQGLIE
jgi:hypothetical protein